MKPSKQLLSAAILIIMAMTTTFAQTTRYVSTTGSDTSDCSDPANPCESVHQALSWANTGDIIDIAAGTYINDASGDYFIQTSVTLQGAGIDGNEVTILRAHTTPGQATHRVISIDNFAPLDVTIKDLIIGNGVAEGSGVAGRGGGIYNPNNGTLTLSNVWLSHNKARVGGGLLNINGGAVSLENSYVSDNEATQRGGGIYNAANTEIDLLNASFSRNEADISGGGIYNEGNIGALDLDNVSFINNKAITGSCGGMCIQPGSAIPTLSDMEFIGNTAAVNGGALHIRGSNPLLVNAAFQGNKANGTDTDNGGGGIYLVDGSSPSLEMVSFVGNSAANYGGGMYMADATPILTEVLFEGNQALGLGAFVGKGGAIYSQNSLYLLMNAIFKENKALNGMGGAICNENSSTTCSNVVFSANEAYFGGAVFNDFGSSPYLYNATFAGNLADSSGGGVCNAGGSAPVFYNTIFWGNSAQNEGNEIYNASDASASLHFSLVSNGADDVEQGGGYTCSDCISSDPLFTNPASHHFQLTENSPAIDGGDPNTGTMPFPVDGNGDPIDILGNPRFFGSAIDIGAYEWNDNLSIEGIAGKPLELLVYPNPATDVLHIESKQIIEQVSIYNLMGKLLPLTPSEGGGTNVMTVNVSGLASGVYLLKVQAEGQEGVYRIIKK